jgi:hypothetical protein
MDRDYARFFAAQINAKRQSINLMISRIQTSLILQRRIAEERQKAQKS